MRHDRVPPAARHPEPAFELPPRLGGRVERRLAGRATAQWLDSGGGERLPMLPSAGLAAVHEFAANSLLLDLRDPCRVGVVSVGSAVAATFGFAPGTTLRGSDGALAARLADACELIRLIETTIPVEGSFAGLESACLLTRGVLMPFAGEDGRLGFAHAVITWKQLLDADASAALHRELDTARRAGNADDHR